MPITPLSYPLTGLAKYFLPAKPIIYQSLRFRQSAILIPDLRVGINAHPQAFPSGAYPLACAASGSYG